MADVIKNLKYGMMDENGFDFFTQQFLYKQNQHKLQLELINDTGN